MLHTDAKSVAVIDNLKVEYLKGTNIILKQILKNNILVPVFKVRMNENAENALVLLKVIK